jgi:hypothetical protein
MNLLCWDRTRIYSFYKYHGTQHGIYTVFQLRKLKHVYPLNRYNFVQNHVNLLDTTRRQENSYGIKTPATTVQFSGSRNSMFAYVVSLNLVS